MYQKILILIDHGNRNMINFSIGTIARTGCHADKSTERITFEKSLILAVKTCE